MFSELVDKIVAETKRGDRRASIVSAVNDVIQRIHSKGLFERDHGEARADNREVDCKLVWPRPRNFRALKTAFINGDMERAPEYVSISKNTHRIDWDYYYYTDESFVFCGDGIKFVSLMYYAKPPQFEYYPEGKRPAVWCPRLYEGLGGWEYLTPDGKAYGKTLGEPSSELLKRYLVTDWLIEEYSSVIMWGAINQLATLISDEDLRRGSFGVFQTGWNDILRDNVHASLGH